MGRAYPCERISEKADVTIDTGEERIYLVFSGYELQVVVCGPEGEKGAYVIPWGDFLVLLDLAKDIKSLATGERKRRAKWM